jgi:hypothetical protein
VQAAAAKVTAAVHGDERSPVARGLGPVESGRTEAGVGVEEIAPSHAEEAEEEEVAVAEAADLARGTEVGVVATVVTARRAARRIATGRNLPRGSVLLQLRRSHRKLPRPLDRQRLAEIRPSGRLRDPLAKTMRGKTRRRRPQTMPRRKRRRTPTVTLSRSCGRRDQILLRVS